MADLAFIQEAVSRGILPDNLKPLYQEAVSRGLIQGASNNPAQTKQPGYIASDTGQFMPTQAPTKQADGRYAGTPAAAPTGNAALGALMGAGNIASGTLNAIPRGLMGIAGAVKGAATPGDSADNAAQRFMDMAPQIPAMQGTGNTQAANQAVTGAAGSMSAALPTGLNSIYSAMRSGKPATGAEAQKEAGDRSVLDLFGNIAPMLITGARAPEASAAEALTPKQSMLQMAQQKYGLKIAPGEAGGAPIASALEDITGAAMAEKLATAKNQPMVNKVGAQELNQPNMPNFTKENLATARKAPSSAYNQVGSVGTVPTDDAYRSDFSNLNLNPNSKGTIPNAKNEQIQDLQDRFLNLKSFDAQDAVNEIGDLRSTGWKNIKAPNAPEQNRLGGAQIRASTALENQLDRYVSSRPEGFDDPGMIQRWKDARVQLAKNHTIEAATVGTDLSVPRLVKAYKNGVPLSGGLLDLAKIGEQFPNSLKDASRIRGPRTFTKLSTTMGGAGVLGAAALGHPAVAATVGGAMLGTPLLRSALLSKPVQASLLPSPGMDPAFLRLLAGGVPGAINSGNQK